MPEANQQVKTPKFSISPEELKRLKLAKKEAKKKQLALQQQQQPQPKQESAPKVLERQFASIPDPLLLTNKVGDLRVMTFNVLAQGLIKRELFPDSGTVLRWKTRRQLVIDEINLYNPDIITLQEMDNYEQYYKDVFDSLGYETKHYKHETKVHGCCIAFKKAMFTVIDYNTIDYVTDSTSPPSYNSGNIGQLLALQLTSNPDICFAVGNTHLYWKPSANYERFRQGIIFSNRLLEFKSKLAASSSSGSTWNLLLFGDFNTTPDEAVYPLLVDNALKQYHMDDLNDSLSVTKSKQASETKEEEESGVSMDKLDSVEELLKKYTKCKWQSVYSHFGKINQNRDEQDFCGEPKFTNYTVAFKGTLDYMFLEEGGAGISIKSILMPPTEECLKPSLPNKNFGSDHLCLVADLEF